nr:hypothetical protein [Pandoravirus aubagnensis]
MRAREVIEDFFGVSCFLPLIASVSVDAAHVGGSCERACTQKKAMSPREIARQEEKEPPPCFQRIGAIASVLFVFFLRLVLLLKLFLFFSFFCVCACACSFNVAKKKSRQRRKKSLDARARPFACGAIVEKKRKRKRH